MPISTTLQRIHGSADRGGGGVPHGRRDLEEHAESVGPLVWTIVALQPLLDAVVESMPLGPASVA